MDREYLKRQLASYIDEMEEEKLAAIAVTRNSFMRWCREAVYRIARQLGETISFPFRLVDDFFKGLWRGLFGRPD